MKYAVNHPHMFVPLKREQGKEKIFDDHGLTRRTMMAFFLGFCQASIGFFVEVLIIYYLSSLTSFIKIVVQYVSLAAVIKFDNFYAKSIHDHGIKNQQKKNLKVFHRRHMLFKEEDEVEVDSEY